LGAWLRWAFGLWLNPIFPTVPLGTLSANLLGGFIMGGVMSMADPLGFPPAVRLLVVTSFLAA
jgi:fluoride exporter